MEEEFKKLVDAYLAGESLSKDVSDEEWTGLKLKIFSAYEGNFDQQSFLDTIWEVSVDDLPGLEVSVVVDRNDRLFISKGTGSFVDYKSENVEGMSIPLKCWIHTHPFGAAYFSGTDWYTIDTQRPILNQATVLGRMQNMKWIKNTDGTEVLSRTEFQSMEDEEE